MRNPEFQTREERQDGRLGAPMKVQKLLPFLFALAGVLASASVSYRFLHEELIVDRCLSGQHGSFDYSMMSCDLNDNHTYMPYAARHPRDLPIFAVGLLLLISVRTKLSVKETFR